MKATSPLLTSEDEFPAVSRRNEGEAGEEEVATKRMVATPGSREIPTAGEGRPELHNGDGDGARRTRRGGQGEEAEGRGVLGERRGSGLLFIGWGGGEDRSRRGEEQPERSPGCHQ